MQTVRSRILEAAGNVIRFDAYASLHVNGTDRDVQSDNCAAGDSGFQVAFL